ncbi:MAG: helix-turn-helix transcriptional regulator [Bacteroidota bacterium]
MFLRAFLFVGIFRLSIALTYGQHYSESYLRVQSYDSLISLFDKNKKDTVAATRIARTYLKKAERDLDSTKMARAYERMSNVSEYEQALVYLDSAIYLSRNSIHKNYPAAPYAFKAYYYYYYDQYEEGLNSAIKAFESARAKENVLYQVIGLDLISAINNLWGNHREALDAEFVKIELWENHPDIRKSRERSYMHTLSGIGTSYVRLKKPDSALFFFKKAIEVALDRNEYEFYFNLVERSGCAMYFKGDYEAALDSLNKGYHGKRDHGDYSTYPYYIGSIYLKQGRQEQGIKMFSEIDSTYKKDNVVYPELAMVYKTLKDHYQKEGKLELQLQYLTDLLVVDSLIREKEKYVKEKTNKEYVIPLLLEEKEQLIAVLESKNMDGTKRIKWILSVLIFSFFGLGYFVTQRRIYKKRFERLLLDLEETKQEPITGVDKRDRSISEDVWAKISENLRQFEEDRGYLSRKITLQTLAKRLKTNANYLSKVINTEKQMNFNAYVNDLRVSASAKRLKEDETFRKYSVKAIAEESGFGSSEYFSKAFYKKFGIYPSYYIKQLEKSTTDLI